MANRIRSISRIRPILSVEQSTIGPDKDGLVNQLEESDAFKINSTTSQIILGQEQIFDFDSVFGSDVSQKELYRACVEDLVTSFIQGYNVSVVGYGGCGSGKSYTITGPGFLWAMNEEEFGLLPRAVRHLYQHINESSTAQAGYESHVSVCYLLLCSGSVFDLLSSQATLSPLPIITDQKGGVMASGLSSIDCYNINEVFNCLEAGLVAKQNHAANTRNSRHFSGNNSGRLGSPPDTHASFTLTLQQHLLDKDGKSQFLCSRLNFVDMAGIDYQMPIVRTISSSLQLTSPSKSSKCNTEVEMISRENVEDFVSLSNDGRVVGSDCEVVMSPDHQCLANVIRCLVEKDFQGVVPYAHSMLTQLLKESFGGNCLTLLVCCATPSVKNLPTTLQTMKYGALARYISNKAIINEIIPPSTMSINLDSTLSNSIQTINIETNSSVTEDTVAISQTKDTAKHCDNSFTGGGNSLPSPSNGANPLPPPSSNGANPLPPPSSNGGNPLPPPSSNGGSSLPPSTTDGSNHEVPVFTPEQEEISRLRYMVYQMQHQIDSGDSLLRMCLPYLPPLLQAQSAQWMCRRLEVSVAANTLLTVQNNNQRDDRALHVIEEVSEPGDANVQSVSSLVTEEMCSSISSLGEEFEEQLAVISSQFAEMNCQLVRNVEVKLDTYTDSMGSDSELTDVNDMAEDAEVNHNNKLVENGSDESDYDSDDSNISDEEREDSDQEMQSCDRSHKDANMCRLTARRNSTVAMTHLPPLQPEVSSVAIHVHQANRRKLKELKETIREKESHLKTLQSSTKEKQEFLKLYESKLEQLEQIITKEETKIMESKAQVKSSKGRRENKRIREFENNLQQYLERRKYIHSLIGILKETQTSSVEIENLSSRLIAMRCELQEVEALVRYDDQRKQELIEFRNNRPRKTSCGMDSYSDSIADCEDIEIDFDLILYPDKGKETQRTEKVSCGGEEHIIYKERRKDKSSSKDAVLNGTHQPNKRRYVSSSSEQYSSDGDADRSQTHFLRIEISNLRDAKTALTTCKQMLHKHISRIREKQMSRISEKLRWEADRRLLEFDEAIEAVDSSIEYKNELICGRKQELALQSNLLLQGNLLDRVLNLSKDEIRSLLVKYFNRVIDIRIEFRKQEVAHGELEIRYENQCRHLQKVEWSYQQASLDMERQCAIQQRQYMTHLHDLLKHIEMQEAVNQQSNFDYNSSHINSQLRDMEIELRYYKDLSTQLKSFIKRQQGMVYNPMPVYQQIQQENVAADANDEQENTGEANRNEGVKGMLSILAPGSTLCSPLPLGENNKLPLVNKRNNITTRQEASLNATALPGESSGVNNNPFVRKSHLEPRHHRRRPPSTSLGGGLARRHRGILGGGIKRFGGVRQHVNTHSNPADVIAMSNMNPQQRNNS